MKWGLIGCGVIGERRALNLPTGVTLTHVFDPNAERAKKISQINQSKVCESIDEVLNSDVDAILISTINAVLFEILQKCISKNKHVLIEKPAARNYAELSQLKNPNGCIIKIGFNHRFHPANDALLKRIQENPDDKIMYVKAQYGNGARLGFEKEWRASVELAGGGELLDQGVHVLDLASQFLPNLKVQAGFTKTHFWQMPVDDNAWAILSDASGATFSMHVSSSEWKNDFRFEVYTQKRKYQWVGLGRSYGVEKLSIYTMKPEMGPPETEELIFNGEDNSWKLENENFYHAIKKTQPVRGGYQDALHCLRLVNDIYLSSLSIQGNQNHPHWYEGK